MLCADVCQPPNTRAFFLRVCCCFSSANICEPHHYERFHARASPSIRLHRVCWLHAITNSR